MPFILYMAKFGSKEEDKARAIVLKSLQDCGLSPSDFSMISQKSSDMLTFAEDEQFWAVFLNYRDQQSSTSIDVSKLAEVRKTTTKPEGSKIIEVKTTKERK